MNPAHPFPNGRPAAASQASRPPQQPTSDAPVPPAAPPGPTAANSAPTEPAGRDSSGRFCRGNKGGPGNPFARKTAALRQALLDTVTAEDLQAIVRQLIQKAKEGDVSAARLVLSYTVGKPDKAVDPDNVDRHEWQQFQQDRVLSDDLLALIGGVQAPLACGILRAVLPIMQQQAAHNLGQLMQDSLKEPAVAADADQPEPDEDAELPDEAEPVAAGPQAPAAPRTRTKQQRATGKAAPGSPRRPLAGCDESAFLAQEQASWIDFLKEVMGNNCPDPGASPPGPSDP